MKQSILAMLICGTGCQHDLALDRRGVLRVVGTNRIFNTQILRGGPKAKILTSDPECICRALGIPHPDPQVIAAKS